VVTEPGTNDPMAIAATTTVPFHRRRESVRSPRPWTAGCPLAVRKRWLLLPTGQADDHQRSASTPHWRLAGHAV